MKIDRQRKPKFVAPDQGANVTIASVDHIRKISGEDTNGKFAFCEVSVPPGGGPPPHVHSREDELFYVLEGTVDILLGTQTYHASAGSLAYLPQGIAHSFHNSSDKTARFVALITPPDFVHFFDDVHKMTARPDFHPSDMARIGSAYGLEFGQERLKQYTGPNAMGEYGLVVTPPEGLCTPYQGGTMSILLEGIDTGGVIATGVSIVPPLDGPPAHVHQTFDELFYVLDGEFLFRADGVDYVAKAGATVYIPRGVVHQFRNIGETRGRLLTYWTPAGFEEWFFHINAMEAQGRMTWEAMRPIARRMDTEMIMDLPQLGDLTPSMVATLRWASAEPMAVSAIR